MLPELCRFVGIPFNPVMFDFYRKKEETMKTYDNPLIERFHSSLMNPVNTTRMEQWRTQMTPAQVRMANVVAGKYALQFKYVDRAEKNRLWLWLQSRPMSIYGWLLFKLYYWGSYLPSSVVLWLSVKLLVLVRAWHFFKGSSNMAKS